MLKLKLFVLTGLALTLPAFAGTGGAIGVSSGQGCALSGQSTALDPYLQMLPSGLDTTSLELSNSYSIDLKPLRADDMSQYQFKTTDNRGLGAGYSSPYLWEAGRGPGGSMMAPPSMGPDLNGRPYFPIPGR